MTTSEAIIKWLYEFDLADKHGGMKQIDTDIQGAKPNTYALIKEPIRNTKNYLSGRKEVTEYYTITARLPSRENAARIFNVGFGESLERWVTEQNAAGHFPDIPNAKVKQIGVTTPFYLGTTETNDSIYQMTVRVMYEKEK